MGGWINQRFILQVTFSGVSEVYFFQTKSLKDSIWG